MQCPLLRPFRKSKIAIEASAHDPLQTFGKFLDNCGADKLAGKIKSGNELFLYCKRAEPEPSLNG